MGGRQFLRRLVGQEEVSQTLMRNRPVVIARWRRPLIFVEVVRNITATPYKERKSPLGTHRFQRAVSGVRRIDRKQTLPASPCLCSLIIASNRDRPAQARCRPTMDLPPATARWKRCVPRDFPQE